MVAIQEMEYNTVKLWLVEVHETQGAMQTAAIHLFLGNAETREEITQTLCDYLTTNHLGLHEAKVQEITEEFRTHVKLRQIGVW